MQLGEDHGVGVSSVAMSSSLAHVGMSSLKKLMKNDLVRGLKDVKFEKDKLCGACQAGKQVANTYPTKAFMTTIEGGYEEYSGWRHQAKR